MARTLLSLLMAQMQVQSLVEELRSHKPLSVTKSKQKKIDFKKCKEDFKEPLNNRTNKIKVDKDICDLNNVINKLYLVIIYRTLHPVSEEYSTFLKCTYFKGQHGVSVGM